MFGASAFALGNVASVRNQGDLQLSRHLLQRLVIVDDSVMTYNAYKSKCSGGFLVYLRLIV